MDFMASVFKKIIPHQNDNKPHVNTKPAAAVSNEHEKKELHVTKPRRSVLKEFDPFITDSPCPPRKPPHPPASIGIKEEEHFGSCEALNTLNKSATSLLIPGFEVSIDPIRLGRISPNPADTSDLEYVEAFESLSSQLDEPKSVSSEEDISIHLGKTIEDIYENVDKSVSDVSGILTPGNEESSSEIKDKQEVQANLDQSSVKLNINTSKASLDSTLGISSAFGKLNIMEVSETSESVNEVSFKATNDSLDLEFKENNTVDFIPASPSNFKETIEQTCENLSHAEPISSIVARNSENETIDMTKADALNVTETRDNIEHIKCKDLDGTQNVKTDLHRTESEDTQNIKADLNRTESEDLNNSKNDSTGALNTTETKLNIEELCRFVEDNEIEILNITKNVENISNNTIDFVQAGLPKSNETIEHICQSLSHTEPRSLNVTLHTENEINKTIDMTQTDSSNVSETTKNTDHTDVTQNFETDLNRTGNEELDNSKNLSTITLNNTETKANEEYSCVGDIKINNLNVSSNVKNVLNDTVDFLQASPQNVKETIKQTCENLSHAEPRSLNSTLNLENELNGIIEMTQTGSPNVAEAKENIEYTKSKCLDVTENVESNLNKTENGDLEDLKYLSTSSSNTTETKANIEGHVDDNKIEIINITKNLENVRNNTVNFLKTLPESSVIIEQTCRSLSHVESKSLNVTLTSEIEINKTLDMPSSLIVTETMQNIDLDTSKHLSTSALNTTETKITTEEHGRCVDDSEIENLNVTKNVENIPNNTVDFVEAVSPNSIETSDQTCQNLSHAEPRSLNVILNTENVINNIAVNTTETLNITNNVENVPNNTVDFVQTGRPESNETIEQTGQNVSHAEPKSLNVNAENEINKTIDMTQLGSLDVTKTKENIEHTKSKCLDPTKSFESDLNRIELENLSTSVLNTTEIKRNIEEQLMSDNKIENLNMENVPNNTIDFVQTDLPKSNETIEQTCENLSPAELRSLNVTLNTENVTDQTIDITQTDSPNVTQTRENIEHTKSKCLNVTHIEENCRYVGDNEIDTLNVTKNVNNSLNNTIDFVQAIPPKSIETIEKTIDITQTDSLNVTKTKANIVENDLNKTEGEDIKNANKIFNVTQNVDDSKDLNQIIDKPQSVLNTTQNLEQQGNILNRTRDVCHSEHNMDTSEDYFEDAHSESIVLNVTNNRKSDVGLRKSLNATHNAESPNMDADKILNETHSVERSDIGRKKSLNVTTNVESPVIKRNKAVQNIDAMVDSLEGPILEKKDSVDSIDQNVEKPENDAEKIMVDSLEGPIIDRKVNSPKINQNLTPKSNLKAKSSCNPSFKVAESPKENCIPEHQNGELDKNNTEVNQAGKNCQNGQNLVAVNSDPELVKKTENLQHELQATKRKCAETMQFAEKYRSDVEKYQFVLGQYEIQIATQDRDLQNLRQENDTMAKHFSNLELAFSDVFQKYEKTKNVVQKYKENEDHLSKVATSMEDAVKQSEAKYHQAKKWFDQQVQEMNNKVINTKEQFNHEICSLKTKVKRYEIKCLSLETALKQKTEECQQLAALCDDISG